MTAKRCELKHGLGAITCNDGRFVALASMVPNTSEAAWRWTVYEICPMCLRRSDHDCGLTIEGAAAKVQELHGSICPSPIARIDDALAILEEPGREAQHKQHTIDQVLRVLLGREYGQWTQDWEAAEGRPWPVGVKEPDEPITVSLSSPADPKPA